MTGALNGHHLGNIAHSYGWDWLPPAVLEMITADLRMFKCDFFPCTKKSGCVPSLQGHQRTASLLTRLHIQSLLPNELYKFNHVEGCLAHHQVLIRL